jgi:cell division protein FtsN
MKRQRGGFVLGLVMGLLIGLAVALGVALYITKTPVPFIDKVPPHTAEQDSAEAERNRNWDPNAALSNKITAGGAGAASGVVTSASSPPGPPGLPPSAAGPAPVAVPKPAPANPAPIPGGAAASAVASDPFVYFVQAGAYTRSEDAEQQRARLGLLGQMAKVTARDQAGRTVYRVRMGPFDTREEADALQARMQGERVDAQIVRVERP